MNLPDNIVEFKLPKRKPKIREKEDVPYQKAYCITPFRAASDKRLHEGTLRVLMMLCSFTNRAGITWVGGTTLGKQLGITKQAVSKQMKILKELGYIQVVSKGFRGERADTTRVIFDETVTTEDAIGIASTAEEDTRPPYLVKREEKEMDDAIRKRLVSEAMNMAKGFGKPNVFKVDVEPRETDSITVREMRAKMKAQQEKVKRVAKAKRDKLSEDANQLADKVEKMLSHSQPAEVDDKPVDNSPHSQLHSQPHSQLLEVDQKVQVKVLDKVIYKELSNKFINIFKNKVEVINKLERQITDEDKLVMLSMIEKGLTEEMWIAVLDDTLQSFASQRRDPPHRIAFFKEGILRALDVPTAGI